jgi:hypothetical protein
MPIRARQLIRRMRGGAQAHLIEADDGHCYVVKFKNNPQHRRILVNEWIATAFLRYLEISAPGAAIVEIDEAFAQSNPDASIQLGSRRVPPAPGWHYGSRFPGDPARIAVFDFLPDVLLSKVVNVSDFAGVFVFDKWTGNSDARQSIYYRAKLTPAHPGEEPRAGFVAWMIDHGYTFDGPHWTFVDSPLQGMYFRPKVYEQVYGWSDFEPWLDRVTHFPEEVVDAAVRQIPTEWLDEDDEVQLHTLLDRLMARRSRIAGLIEDARSSRPDRFPNWK